MKQSVIFDTYEEKKHSVCYNTTQENPAVTSIYVMKTALPKPYPKKITVTLSSEE